MTWQVIEADCVERICSECSPKGVMPMNSSNWSVLEGDAVEEMRKMDENSIDAIVCDPPY